MKKPKRLFPNAHRFTLAERRQLTRRRSKHWYCVEKYVVDPATLQVLTVKINPDTGKVYAITRNTDGDDQTQRT